MEKPSQAYHNRDQAFGKFEEYIAECESPSVDVSIQSSEATGTSGKATLRFRQALPNSRPIEQLWQADS